MKNLKSNLFKNKIIIITIILTIVLLTQNTEIFTTSPKPGTNGIILTDGLILRNLPSSKGKYITKISKDTIVRVIAKSKVLEKIGKKRFYWYKIKLRNGKKGWVYGKFIAQTKKSLNKKTSPNRLITSSYAMITAEKLIMRAKPRIKGKILTYLNESTIVKILRASKKISKIGKSYFHWYKVKNSKGVIGWVYGKHLRQIASGLKPLKTPGYAKIDAIGLSLRKKASEKGKLVHKLENNEYVRVLRISKKIDKIDGKSQFWYKIKTVDGKKGWAFGAYIKTAPKRKYIKEYNQYLKTKKKSKKKKYTKKKNYKYESVYSYLPVNKLIYWEWQTYDSTIRSFALKKVRQFGLNSYLCANITRVEGIEVDSSYSIYSAYDKKMHCQKVSTSTKYGYEINQVQLKKPLVKGTKWKINKNRWAEIVDKNYTIDIGERRFKNCLVVAEYEKIYNNPQKMNVIKEKTENKTKEDDINDDNDKENKTDDNMTLDFLKSSDILNSNLLELDINQKKNIDTKEIDHDVPSPTIEPDKKNKYNSKISFNIRCKYKYYAKDIGLVAEKEFIVSSMDNILPHERITVITKWITNYGDPVDLIIGKWERQNNNFKKELIFTKKKTIIKKIYVYNSETDRWDKVIIEHGKYLIERDIIKMNFNNPSTTMSEFPIPYSEELIIEFPEEDTELIIYDLSGKSYEKQIED